MKHLQEEVKMGTIGWIVTILILVGIVGYYYYQKNKKKKQ